jgi:hypothetical protein
MSGPLSSNAKFDWSYLEQKTPGSSQVFDEATSPAFASVIRDIENLYLLLTDGTSDGQTGSPENAWQDVGENGGDAGGGTVDTATGSIPAGYSEITLVVCDGSTSRNLSVIGKWL